MKNDFSRLMKARIMDGKLGTLEETLSIIRGDISSLLSNYINFCGDVVIDADIDEKSGNVLLSIRVTACEIFECGKFLGA